MSVSDAEANANLNQLVARGGSFWVGFSTTLPDGVLSAGSITEAPIGRVALPLNGSTTWEAASGRAVQPHAGVTFGAVTEAFEPVAVVFWSAQTGGTPLRSARCVPIATNVGATVSLSAEALHIVVPTGPTL